MLERSGSGLHSAMPLVGRFFQNYPGYLSGHFFGHCWRTSEIGENEQNFKSPQNSSLDKSQKSETVAPSGMV